MLRRLLRVRSRKLPYCPRCGELLLDLQMRPAPGSVDRGPYYHCPRCITAWRTEDRKLVPG